MDWPTTIARLLDAGWTQKRLAEQCGCAQPTISDLHCGKTKAPSYPVGKELERLAAELPAAQQQAA